MPNHHSPLAGSVKFIIGWIGVFAIRLFPYRPPNIEPLTATLLPFAKHYGAPGSFLFGFLGIALFDAVTSGIGTWTLITGVAYGCLGVAAALFFRNRTPNRKNFVVLSILGTLAYDAITGLSIGPLFFDQPLREAFFGQIPFTALHLAGNVVLGATLSPILYHWVVANEKLELPRLFSRFRSA